MQVPSLEPVSISVTALRRGWHYVEARAFAPSPGTAATRRRGAPAQQQLTAVEIAAFRVVHLEERTDADVIDLGFRGIIQLVDSADAPTTTAKEKDGVVAICRRTIWAPGDDREVGQTGEDGVAAMAVVEEDEFAVWVGGYATAYDAAVQVGSPH